MTRSIAEFSKLALVLILIGCMSSYAQNANDAVRLGLPGLGANARALGMGNSYIGLSDDASAAYFNPAGFGLIKRMEFSGGLQYTNFGNNTTFMNQATDYSNSSTTLDRLSFAFPFPTMRGSLVFGLSYHESKDLTGAVKFDGFNSGNNSLVQSLLEQPYPSDIPYQLYLASANDITLINGNLNQSGSIINTGAIHNWTFSGAIEAYKNLFLGLNLNILSGSFKSDNDYFEDDTQNRYGRVDPTDTLHSDFMTFNLRRILDWDLSGWDVKVGLLYQFNNMARFGLTVQFPKSFDVKEKFTVNGSSYFSNDVIDLNSSDYSDQVEYNIITPYELGMGFSYNIRGLILSAQGTLMDYSQMKFEDISGLGTTNVEDINTNIKDQLAAVFNYNFGFEYTFPRIGVRLRGGYMVQPSPYKGDPTEYDHKYVTGGMGFLVDETMGLDLAFAHGWWKDFGDNYDSDVSRTYQDVSVNKLILTATYRF
jgi:long-subunit fatty acid transport protein